MAKTETGRRSMKIPDARIEKIAAAEKAAKPTEWCEKMVLRGYLGQPDGENIDIELAPGKSETNEQRRANAAFIAMSRTAIPELLSEREEREREIERLGKEADGWHGVVTQCEELFSCSDTAESYPMSNLVNLVRDCMIGAGLRKAIARAESAEKALVAVRDWALTARRLWGGGGGVHWKSFYAILDAGKGE